MKNLDKTLERIKLAQKVLQKKYSPEEYKKTVKQLIVKTNGGNIEILTTIAQDNKSSATIRLFAVAAMGE